MPKFARMKLAQKIAVNFLRAKLNVTAVISKQKAAEQAFRLFCTPLRKTRKKKPPIFNKAEDLSFDVDGVTISGNRWNHPQSKKCLIVHGFESSAYNFERYISILIRDGYEVLAFDAPAHGRSSGKQITLPLYVKTLAEINQQFGPINFFIAHSFGGLALSHFLESTRDSVDRRIVFIAPATETTSAIDSFFKFLQLNGQVREKFDTLIQDIGGKPAAYYSIRRAMREIKSPVLWVHDTDDEMTPVSDALRIKEDNHPNIEFYITSGLGHRRIYRDNNVTRKVMNFLKNTVDTPTTHGQGEVLS